MILRVSWLFQAAHWPWPAGMNTDTSAGGRGDAKAAAPVCTLYSIQAQAGQGLERRVVVDLFPAGDGQLTTHQ